MRLFVLYLILLFSFISVNATEISNAEVESQEYDQSICVTQRVKQCLKQCNPSGIKDCVQLCTENAQNECRQAGE